MLAPIAVAWALYGKEYVRSLDWRLIKATLWVYLAILVAYSVFRLVRAAWQCNLARQKEIAHRDALLVESEREFGQMVASKDSERAAVLEEVKAQLNADFGTATQHWIGEVAVRDSEIVELKKLLENYKLVWTVLQSRTGTLAKELRIYCEETVAPEPIPPPVDGESDADILVRKAKLMQPWMDKINREYNGNFAERVAYLRDYFAEQGFKDLKLDYRINTAVVHADQVSSLWCK